MFSIEVLLKKYEHNEKKVKDLRGSFMNDDRILNPKSLADAVLKDVDLFSTLKRFNPKGTLGKDFTLDDDMAYGKHPAGLDRVHKDFKQDEFEYKNIQTEEQLNKFMGYLEK